MADRPSTPQPHELDRLQELMERVGEDEGRVDNLLTVAALDAETHTDLMDLYERRAAQVVTKDVFYPYEAMDGEIELGTDLDGQRIGLTRKQLNKHVLLVGMTGSGKTTLFYNLMDQLTVPFWAFDLKQDYRHFLRQDKDLLVLPWTELKFNHDPAGDGRRHPVSGRCCVDAPDRATGGYCPIPGTGASDRPLREPRSMPGPAYRRRFREDAI